MRLTLNLATRTYFNRRAVRTGLVVASAVLGMLLLWNLVALGREASHLRWIKQHASELEQELVRSRGLEGPPVSDAVIAKRKKEVELVNGILLRESFQWSRLLTQLEGLSVDGITLVSIVPEARTRSHKLTGLARDVDSLRRYLDRLNERGDFRGVFLLNQERTSVSDGRGGERTAVKFSVELAGGEF